MPYLDLPECYVDALLQFLTGLVSCVRKAKTITVITCHAV